MTHDELLELLSAKVDGELTPDQHAQLEQHLQENADDRVLLEAFQLQDVQLRETFEPYRERATKVAETLQLDSAGPPGVDPKGLPRTTRPYWLAFAIAASLLAVLLWSPWNSPIRVVEGVAKPHLNDSLADAGIRPTPLPASMKAVEIVRGEKLQTAAGERKRVTLPDGSTLFLNQNSSVSLDDNRQLTLDAGEIYLSAVPAAETPDKSKFIVKANGQTLTALGTKFAVRTGEGPNLMVTQGKVEVSGFQVPVSTGEQLAFAAAQTEPSPRASVVLDWTRELLTESETPLVPGSKFSGGSLVAVDPYGQEAKLSLVNYHVDAHIEDGFARTTIDQTYFNHENFQMEGTFYFPLPPDASLSRLAMYVNGNLMEGGMAERDHARNTYEKIRHSMRDPALLEWIDGSMFKMRVFPLEARQEKRILLSYTQKLPSAYGRTQYRFPAGHSLNLVDQWSFQAFVKNGEKLRWFSPSHPKMKKDESKKDGLTLVDSEKNAKLDRDISLELIDETIAPAQGESIGWSSTEHDGQRYLMLRYQPDLPSEPKRERRDWVFLFESSGARDPLLARTQVEIVRSLLTQAEHDDTFNVLTVGTRVSPWQAQGQIVNSTNVDSAIRYLESAHLIGATNLEAGLQTASAMLQGSKNPYLVHLGGGIASLGESRSDRLVGMIPITLKYIGIAVGKRFTPQLMKVAAEKTCGYFTQINPDESIAWRGFELFSTLNAPRLLNIRAETMAPTKLLSFSTSIVQGEAYACVCKLPADEKQDPKSVTLKGLLNGVPFEKILKVEKISTLATYLPRTWAKLEIDRLLAEDSSGNKNRIIELSKQMYVMTPYTSLLVLENEQMYRDFKVDRGRKDHWAMYPAPPKIPIVYIPDAGRPLDRNAPDLGVQKPHENQVRQSILVRTPAPILTWPSRDSNREEGFGDRAFAERITTAPFSESDARMIFGRSGATKSKLLSSGGGNATDPVMTSYIGDLSWDADRSTIYPDSETLSRNFTAYNFATLRDGTYTLVKESSKDQISEPLLRQQISRLKSISRNERESIYVPQSTISGESFLGIAFTTAQPETKLRLSEETVMEVDAALRLNRDQFGLFFDPFAQPEKREEAGRARSRLSLRGLDDRRVKSIIVDRVPAPDEYQRIYFARNERLFTDLVAFAPGMSSQPADVQAAIEAEAAPRFGTRLGRIDPQVRQLVEAARTAEWSETVIESTTGEKETIQHDGQGRYRYERTLPLGLIEQVYCDGQNLWHLYPELGVGAKRTVSRFHRADFAAMIPDVLPPVEDLARGADLTLADANTLVLKPLGVRPDDSKAKWVELHIRFEANRVVEQQQILMPEKKRLAKFTFHAVEGVKQFDGTGKEIGSRKQTRTKLNVAPPAPRLDELVILPLPLRDRTQVYWKHHLEPNLTLNDGPNPCFEYMAEDEVLELIAAELAANRGDAVEQLWRKRFFEQGDRRIGFLSLILSSGSRLTENKLLRELVEKTPNDPLVRYLAHEDTLRSNSRTRNAQAGYGLNTPRELLESPRFLDRLMCFNALRVRWESDWIGNRYLGYHTWEVDDGFRFIRANADNSLGFAALSMFDNALSDPAILRRIADLWTLVGERSGLKYVGEYEKARALYRAEDFVQSRERFERLYAETLKQGILPPVDSVFRAALQTDQIGEAWPKRMKQTAQLCIDLKHRPLVVRLAWKCSQLGDHPLAESLLELALSSLNEAEEAFETRMAAIEYLSAIRQYDRAEAICLELLKSPENAKELSLWRLAAQLASQRGQTLREIECLETALNLEFDHLPQVVDLQSFRNDYGRLLSHYEYLAKASKTLNVPMPSDLGSRTVRAADRWRSIDPEGDDICRRAANILRELGTQKGVELAWDYLTTPLALKPNESSPWLSLADTLVTQGEHQLADQCFQQAFAAEPTNAEILWNRAQHLQRSGDAEQSRKQLRQLADGDWQPRFQWLKTQARMTLEGR